MTCRRALRCYLFRSAPEDIRCDHSRTALIQPIRYTPSALEGFHIYPNPAQESIHITTYNTGTWSVTIYNLLGQVMYSSHSRFRELVIRSHIWDAGNYIISLSQDGRSSSQLLQVIH